MFKWEFFGFKSRDWLNIKQSDRMGSHVGKENRFGNPWEEPAKSDNCCWDDPHALLGLPPWRVMDVVPHQNSRGDEVPGRLKPLSGELRAVECACWKAVMSSWNRLQVSGHTLLLLHKGSVNIPAGTE